MGIGSGTGFSEGAATQMQVEYDGSGNAIYVGFAYPGVATDAGGWLIQKMTYSNDRLTVRKIFTDGAWDSRAGYTYV